MRYNLFKISSPGWSMYGADLNNTIMALKPHICGMCQEDDMETPIEFTEESLHEMMGTACGCEFVLEEVPDMFIGRVKMEEEELSDKIYRLDDFINSERFKDMSDKEQIMLMTQLSCMKGYREVLINRIKHYEEK